MVTKRTVKKPAKKGTVSTKVIKKAVAKAKKKRKPAAKKTKKNKGGRPTKMTNKCIAKLEDAFSWGCTDSEACCYVDIDLATLYRYCEKNESFRDRKEKLKDMPVMKAKRIQDAALKEDSLSQANRVIDRKEGTKVNSVITGANGGPIQLAEVIFNPVDSND